MAEKMSGKITQVIGAILDVRFDTGKLPEINEAIGNSDKGWLHIGGGGGSAPGR